MWLIDALGLGARLNKKTLKGERKHPPREDCARKHGVGDDGG